jgi:hypothetical protein
MHIVRGLYIGLDVGSNHFNSVENLTVHNYLKQKHF